MSDTPPPPPPPGPNPNDARARAAADRAYAKASRPWYKKKRWIGAIVLVALIVIVSVSGGGGSSDDSQQASNSSEASSGSDGSNTSTGSGSAKSNDKGAVGTEDNPAPRGTTVKNKSASYRVDNVQVKDSLGDFADAPSGKFVVVTLTVKNVKNKTIQISSEDFKLRVAGTELDADSDAVFLDNAFNYDDLSPGLKRTGTVVFDVAPKNAGKGVLVAQALLSLDDPQYLKLQR